MSRDVVTCRRWFQFFFHAKSCVQRRRFSPPNTIVPHCDSAEVEGVAELIDYLSATGGKIATSNFTTVGSDVRRTADPRKRVERSLNIQRRSFLLSRQPADSMKNWPNAGCAAAAAPCDAMPVLSLHDGPGQE